MNENAFVTETNSNERVLSIGTNVLQTPNLQHFYSRYLARLAMN